MKVGRGLRHFFQSDSDTKKRKLKILDSWKQWFPAVMNNQSPDRGFIEISLLLSQHYPSVKINDLKIVLNTASAEASCGFILISEIVDDAQIYDTNNEHSFDLSEYKKRCLKLRKFVDSFKIYIKQTKNLIEWMDPQVSVENLKVLML